MASPQVKCSICGKLALEYCSALTCRACHISISFEDCLNKTTPEEKAWEALKGNRSERPQ